MGQGQGAGEGGGEGAGQGGGAASDTRRLISLILCLFFPPAGVFLVDGCAPLVTRGGVDRPAGNELNFWI